MDTFKNAEGKNILLKIVTAIQANKDYLGEIDGLIGDGDHGMNMNKGFSVFEKRFSDKAYSFTDGLENLGNILFSEIGGSMGPIYGTVFMDMASAGGDQEEISLMGFTKMLDEGLKGLQEIVDARVGDKTLIDTLNPAIIVLNEEAQKGTGFAEALKKMKAAAKAGKESTKGMIAKYGRSARLGERSRGVLDAGAVSCFIILEAMADGIIAKLK